MARWKDSGSCLGARRRCGQLEKLECFARRVSEAGGWRGCNFRMTIRRFQAWRDTGHCAYVAKGSSKSLTLHRRVWRKAIYCFRAWRRIG